jgi:hypothetical protein
MAFANGPKIVTDGLVLSLDAADRTSYSGGTTWYDLSENNGIGTLNNGPTFNSANGGSIVFDGSDDSVTLPTNSNIDFNSSESFTVCYWIYTTSKGSDTGYDAHVGKISGNGWVANLNWTPFGSGDLPQLRWWLNGNVTVTYNTLKPYLNNWRYVCMQVNRSNTTGIIFEDGIQVASGNIGSPDVSNSGLLLIGNDVFGSAFIGRISIIQLYVRALSSQEILQNYNATKSRFGL